MGISVLALIAGHFHVRNGPNVTDLVCMHVLIFNNTIRQTGLLTY